MDTTQSSLLWAVSEHGDEQAWNLFYRIYAPMLRQFSRRMGLNEVEADDVLQEVLLVVHRALREKSYDPAKGRFRGWLFGVVRHRALSAQRARQRRTRAQSVASDTGIDLLAGVPDTHDEAAAEIWAQEWRYAMLEEALRQLQPSLGEKVFRAFVLYAMENRPPAEVAAELEIATASVYTYKNRVLNAIKEWVAGFEDDGPPEPGDVVVRRGDDE